MAVDTKLLAQEIEVKHPKLIKVAKKLSNPHSLIIRKRKYWKEKRKDWRYGSGEKNISIKVTERNEMRALRFMDALFKLLEARGHSIKIKNYETVAIVFDIELEIYLREANKRIPPKDKYSTGDYVPTGILVLKTNRWWREKEWKDGKTQNIEDKLSDIVARLEVDALEEIENKKRIDLNHKRYEEEKLIKEKKLALINTEKEKTINLIRDSENYIRANSIRKYIEALEKRSIEPLDKDYIEWAKKKADWIDPLLKTEDSVLGIYNETDFQE